MNLLEKFSPIGRVDRTLRDFLKDESVGEDFLDSYNKSYLRFKNFRTVRLVVLIFLYSSFVTSIGTTLGIEEVNIIFRIASYIGTSVLVIMYIVVKYFCSIYREEFYLQRDILLNRLD